MIGSLPLYGRAGAELGGECCSEVSRGHAAVISDDGWASQIEKTESREAHQAGDDENNQLAEAGTDDTADQDCQRIYAVALGSLSHGADCPIEAVRHEVHIAQHDSRCEDLKWNDGWYPPRPQNDSDKFGCKDDKQRPQWSTHETKHGCTCQIGGTQTLGLALKSRHDGEQHPGYDGSKIGNEDHHELECPAVVSQRNYSQDTTDH